MGLLKKIKDAVAGWFDDDDDDKKSSSSSAKKVKTEQTQAEKDMRQSSKEMQESSKQKAMKENAPKITDVLMKTPGQVMTSAKKDITKVITPTTKEQAYSDFRESQVNVGTSLPVEQMVRNEHGYIADKDWENYDKLRREEFRLSQEIEESGYWMKTRGTDGVTWAANYRKNPNWTTNAEILKRSRYYAELEDRWKELIKKYEYIDKALHEYEKSNGVRLNAQGDVDTKTSIKISDYQSRRAKRLSDAASASVAPYLSDPGILMNNIELSGTVSEQYKSGELQRKRSDFADVKSEAYKDFEEDKDKQYNNNPLGIWSGNSKLGKIGLKQNRAGYSSYNMNTDDTEAYDVYDMLTKRITENNYKTFLNDSDLKRGFADVARYAPQFLEQQFESIKGMVVGGLAGAAVTGGAGTAKGARIGSAAATAAYMFKQTAGSVYVRMLKNHPDISVEDAKMIATSEAVASSIIEFGLDFATSGLWSGSNKVTKGAMSKGLREAEEAIVEKLVSKGIKRHTANTALKIAKTAGKTAIDSLGEGLEEGWQEGVSKNADRMVSEGKDVNAFKLLTESFDFSKYSEQDLEDMKQAAISGMIVSPFGSAVQGGFYGSINRAALNSTGGELINSGYGDSAIDAALAAGRTKSQSIAKNIISKMESGITVSKAELGELSETMRSENIRISDDAVKFSGNHVYTKEGGGLASTVAGAAISKDMKWQLNRLGEITKTNIVPVMSKGDGDFGWFDENDSSRFYVSVNTKRPVIYTAIHELTHTMRGTEAYNEYKKYIINTIKKDNRTMYDAIINNIKTKYKERKGKDVSTAFAEDEIVADVAIKVNNNYSQMLRLIDTNPKFAKQLADKVIDVYQRVFKPYEQNNNALVGEGADFKKAAEMWAQAAKEKGVYIQADDAESVDNGDNVRFSIKYSEDGVPVTVVINDDVFANHKGEKPHKVIKNYLKKHIGDFATIIESGQKVYLGKDLPGEYVHSNSTRNIKKQVLNAKNQASQNIGEMIEIASNRQWTPNIKDKHVLDAKFGWYKYNTAFRIGDTDYSANLLVRNDANGKKYLYDIINIKEETNSSASNHKKGLTVNSSISSNDNISQDKDSVNTYYANNSENDSDKAYSMDYATDVEKDTKADDVRTVASNLILNYGADVLSNRDVSNKLRSIRDKMRLGINGNKDEYEAAVDEAYSLARELLENGTAYGDVYLNDEVIDARKYLRNTPIRIPESVKKSFPTLGYDSFNQFRKSNMGSLRIANDGIEIDSLYQELSSTYPTLFNSEAITEEAQIEQILDFIETSNPTRDKDNLPFVEEDVREAAMEILDEFGRNESDGALPASWHYFSDDDKQAWEDAADDEESRKKISKFYENSIMGKETFKDIQSVAEARIPEFMYDGISNKETYEFAQSSIEIQGVERATTKLLAKAASDKAWTADDTAMALALMSHYQTNDDPYTAVDIASALRGKLTQAGQMVQAAAIVNKLTPEGKFIELQRQAEEINAKAEKTIRKKKKGETKKHRQMIIDEYEAAVEQDKKNEAERLQKKKEQLEGGTEDSGVKDITKVLKKPVASSTVNEDNDSSNKNNSGVKNITDVIHKPGEKNNHQEFELKDGSEVPEVGEQGSLPGYAEKSEVEKVFDKYRIKYVPKAELAKLGEAFDVISKIKTPEDLINLIMKQSEKRGTVHNNTVRKALEKQNITLLKDVANKQVFGMLRDMMPVSFWRKTRTYQTIAMLLSAPTMLRNTSSNSSFNMEEGFAYNLASVFDSFAAFFTPGEYHRVKSLGFNKGMFRKGSFKAKVDNARIKYLDIALDVDSSSDLSKQQEGMRGRTFKGKLLGSAERWMSYGLGVTDEYTKGGIEHDIYEGLKKIKNNPYTDAEMREIARQEARYRTFQDENFVSVIFKGLKDLADGNFRKNGDARHEFGAGDLLIKFTQVPGALLTRSFEFSPWGYGKVIYHLARHYDSADSIPLQKRRDVCLSLARAVTGTGICAAGFLFAKSGVIILTDDEEDKDLKTLKNNEGLKGLQINISKLGRMLKGEFDDSPEPRPGDKLISIGFMEPFNTSLIVGAVLAKEDKITLGSVLEASTTKTWDQFADISMMQSLRTFLDVSKGRGKPIDVAVGFLGDAVSGFTPAPMRQLAKTIDPIQRNPYNEKNVFKKTGMELMQNIPFMSKNVPAKITMFGDEKSNDTGSVFGNALNNFVNPAYLSVYQPSDVSSLVYGLHGYNPGVLPKVAPTSFTLDGVKIKITGQSYVEWAQLLGRNTNNAILDYANSAEFELLSEQEKADKIADIVNKAYSDSKIEFVEMKDGVQVRDEKTRTFGDYDSVSTFRGLPKKEYVEYGGAKYELSEKTAKKYNDINKEFIKLVESQVVEQDIPLNQIDGFEKAYYYTTGADGKRKKTYYDKKYSEYPMSVKKKIVEKIKDEASELVKKEMEKEIKSTSTAAYVIDKDIEAAIEKGDFSKTKWIRLEEGGTSGNSSQANDVIDTARQYIGVKYVWGGTTPKGFDCSGLMQYVYAQHGVKINRTAAQQFRNGTSVSKGSLQPGDMVFFKGSRGSSNNPGHVGMYLGNDQFLHAPQTGDVVKISKLSARGDYVGARRVLNS